MLLISLTQPKFLVPISGTYRHMIAYRDLAEKMNYKRNHIFLIENGQEVVFTAQQAKIGKKIEIQNVYVDEVTGEELESYVVRDRERLAREGVVILLVEIHASTSQLARTPERGHSAAPFPFGNKTEVQKRSMYCWVRQQLFTAHSS